MLMWAVFENQWLMVPNAYSKEYADILGILLGCYHLGATFLDHTPVGIEKGSGQKDVRDYRTWESI